MNTIFQLLKKTLLSSCALVFSCNLLFAQSQAELMIQAKILISQLHEDDAYPVIVEAVKVNNKNMEALTMAAYYASRVGNREHDKNKKLGYFKQSQIFADAALKLDPNNAEANYVMCVALGRMALEASSKQKVALSKQIKELAEKCIKLDPNLAGGWHALGKWHYEVFNLNFAEKAAISMLFGGMPTGDINLSCQAYAKAISLRPKYLLYYYDYALALIDNNKDAEAMAQLKKLVSMKQLTQDDAGIIADAKKLMAKM